MPKAGLREELVELVFYMYLEREKLHVRGWVPSAAVQLGTDPYRNNVGCLHVATVYMYARDRQHVGEEVSRCTRESEL